MLNLICLGSYEEGKVSPISKNHYAFGAVGNWMYQNLAGIQIAEPGYKKSVIAPLFDCGLEWVSAWHKTEYGRISSEWKIVSDCFELNVEIPANTSAELKLAGVHNITIDGVAPLNMTLFSGSYLVKGNLTL